MWRKCWKKTTEHPTVQPDTIKSNCRQKAFSYSCAVQCKHCEKIPNGNIAAGIASVTMVIALYMVVLKLVKFSHKQQLVMAPKMIVGILTTSTTTTMATAFGKRRPHRNNPKKSNQVTERSLFYYRLRTNILCTNYESFSFTWNCISNKN